MNANKGRSMPVPIRIVFFGLEVALEDARAA